MTQERRRPGRPRTLDHRLHPAPTAVQLYDDHVRILREQLGPGANVSAVAREAVEQQIGHPGLTLTRALQERDAALQESKDARDRLLVLEQIRVAYVRRFASRASVHTAESVRDRDRDRTDSDRNWASSIIARTPLLRGFTPERLLRFVTVDADALREIRELKERADELDKRDARRERELERLRAQVREDTRVWILTQLQARAKRLGRELTPGEIGVWLESSPDLLSDYRIVAGDLDADVGDLVAAFLEAMSGPPP